ncbi:MAG: L-arabinose isomerase [Candidatus Izemoplasmataceae bacterium]
MKKYQFWFIVGTQHLYGEKIFASINDHAKEMAEYLNINTKIDADIVFKQIVKTSDEIYEVMEEANQHKDCAGVITWMHTFSPSKMWIKGLNILQKPLVQLHTQYNQEIPFEEIDMDFMNLNQSAHGDREHGFIHAVMRRPRKVISGYYKNERVVLRIEKWMRSAVGVAESRKLHVVRFGDNMRNVAVTEGNKVSAEIKFGWSVNGYGIGDLAEQLKHVTQLEIREQMDKYKQFYELDTSDLSSVEYQAKIQVAMRQFLDQRNAKAFTTTFEDLHGLNQLPGLAVQDLMREGYGFGAEGDWKTSALLRVMNSMSVGLDKGNSFMEDYTYHLPYNEELVLGAHMLEVSPSIAKTKPVVEVHPLGIGSKNDPARAVFDAKEGKAIQASLIDLGNRFRLIVTDCIAVEPKADMPKLPVARAMWKLLPNFEVATEAWLLSGGAHHTVMSYDLDVDVLRDYADMMDIEFVHINKDTKIETLREQLIIKDIIYKFK